MLKHEFEIIAGYEVSDYDYEKIIEPMYMSVNLDKHDFVKVIDKNRFALKTKSEIVAQLKKYACQLKDTCTHFTDWETKEKFEKLFEEYKNRFDKTAWVSEKEIWTCFYPDQIVSDNYENINFH